MIRLYASAAALGMALAPPALAQTGVSGTAAEEVLIRVDVREVADELSGTLGIEPDALPRSVELPVETAALVCEFAADELKLLAAAEQHLECAAVTVSEELSDAAMEQLAR